jgi:hypothetical protein
MLGNLVAEMATQRHAEPVDMALDCYDRGHFLTDRPEEDPLRRPVTGEVSQEGSLERHPANTCEPDITYATSGRVISGARRCNARLGLVRGAVLHVAAAVSASASITNRTRCGVVIT